MIRAALWILACSAATSGAIELASSQALGNEDASSTTKIEFKLYNRSAITEPIETYIEGQDSFYTTFDADKKTIILIGGWEPRGFPKSVCQTVLTNASLEQYDCNVIQVDWPAARDDDYILAVEQMTMTGVRTAEFIDKLVATFNVSLEDIHIIGHSLGAHVSGIAGYNVKSGKIGRVTGLDAARPLIDFANHNKSLSTESAQLVVNLHTSLLGVRKPIGHIDFYANTGTSSQPGCILEDLFMSMCSHHRSYQLYAEAITDPNGFEGLSCDTYQHFRKGVCSNGDKLFMNETIPSSARGSYFFYTKSSSPYAEGADD